MRPLLIAVISLALVAGCGRKGDPLPPPSAADPAPEPEPVSPALGG